MDTIRIDVEKRVGFAEGRGLNWDEHDVDEAIEVANGILVFIDKNGWMEGFRNNMAVDLSIACHYIGYDPVLLIDETMGKSFEDITLSDDEDAEKRLTKVKWYLDYGWKHDPSMYYADKHHWKRMSKLNAPRFIERS